MLSHEGFAEILPNRGARVVRLMLEDVKNLLLVCANPSEYSNLLTVAFLADGFDEAEFRKLILDEFDLSLDSSGTFGC